MTLRVKARAKKAGAASRKAARARHEFRIKRVYDEPSPDDGLRFLVDRLWPRGVKKSALASVVWLRDVAPSAPLRKWFDHEPAKWAGFRKCYHAELEKNPAAYQPLLDAKKKDEVTLLFASRNAEMNHAMVLKEFLEEKEQR